MYNSAVLSTFTLLCVTTHLHLSRTFSSSQTVTTHQQLPIPSSPATTWNWCPFCLYESWLLQIPHINRMLWHMFFSAWLISLQVHPCCSACQEFSQPLCQARSLPGCLLRSPEFALPSSVDSVQKGHDWRTHAYTALSCRATVFSGYKGYAPAAVLMNRCPNYKSKSSWRLSLHTRKKTLS